MSDVTAIQAELRDFRAAYLFMRKQRDAEIERLCAINAELLAELKHADRWLSGMHSDADGDDITELREVHGAAWEAIDKMRAAIAKAKP